MFTANQETLNQHSHIVPDGTIREVVGLFENAEDLQAAIRALEGTAFPRQDISIMGGKHAIETAFGSGDMSSYAIMDDPYTPRIAPSRPEEQTIGSAAMVGIPAYIGTMALALAAGAVSVPATIGAAIIGGIGGATAGGILSKILHDKYHAGLDERIHKGGLLLWVRVPDGERERLALDIMTGHGGHDVHAHETV